MMGKNSRTLSQITVTWPVEDFPIGVYKTGAFNFEIVFNPFNNDEDKVHVVITEVF